MSVGEKIKKYRNDLKITQKDLADKVNVTPQALSKWENDESEPSFQSIKDLCEVFGCTPNDLFDSKSMESQTGEVEPTQLNGKILYGYCEHCNKPLFDITEFKRTTEKKSIRNGKLHQTVENKISLCNDCYEKKEKEEQLALEQAQKERHSQFLKRRIKSFIFPTLIFALLLALAINFFTKGDTQSGLSYIIIAILAFTFAGTVILKNNIVCDLWLHVLSWGFVKFPGVIFEFSLDGFIFLIVVKVIFFILGMIFATIAFIAATIIAMVVSIFIYPYALYKNFKEVE